MNSLSEKLKIFASASSLPEHDDLLSSADSCISVLESESAVYRPKDRNSKPGGLLDFTGEKSTCKNIPVIIVPDLHARAYFLQHILDFKPQIPSNPERLSVFELLERGKIAIVCVGDLFHSEKRGMRRWFAAWDKHDRGNYESPEITDEMKENLSLLEMVFTLKTEFPTHFHFLKGNHENVLNTEGRGDHPFCKFAAEGEMVYDFMSDHYGDALIHVIRCWELALPLVAVFPEFIVSHAEPRRAFSKDEIVNCSENPDVVDGLIWTENDRAEDGSVFATMKNLLPGKNAEAAVWFAGHRPVPENYAMRQNGKFIQFHNPEKENIALIVPGRKIDLDRDILSVNA